MSSRLVTVCLAFAIVACPNLSAAGSPDSLTAPVREAWVAGDFSERLIPRWIGGQLVAVDHHAFLVTLFGPDGSIAAQHRVDIPGTAQLRIYGATRSKSGRLAVSGSAVFESGDRAFLAWLSADGKVETVVRMDDRFAPLRFVFGADDSLWVFGRELGPLWETRQVRTGDLLRQYSPDGRLLRSAIPVNTFASIEHPGRQGSIAVTEDSVWIYSASAREVVRVSQDSGEVTGRWKGLPMKPGDVRTLEAAEGTAFVEARVRNGNRAPSSIYRLDLKDGSWHRLDASEVLPDDPEPSVFLLGVDGEHLVIGQGVRRLLWVAIPSPL